MATVRKTLLVVASVLALSACSAKSVEVSTETTMDPTAGAVSPDAGLASCAASLTAIYEQTMTSLKPVVAGASTNDGQVFAQIKTGIDIAGARFLVAKSGCQADAPDCVDAGIELVEYYTARLDNIVQLSRSAYGGGPAAVTQPVGPQPELVCR